LSPTTLTPSTQSDYNDAAVAAQVEFDDEVERFIASARDLLDSQGQVEWVEWAGEGIMPLTARAKKELVEQGEVEQGEAEQGEVEDRAAHFERRRDLLEASFEAGEVNSEEFARQMAAIYDEEDGEKVEEGGEPPASDFEDDAKGDDESDPDAKGDGEPNRNDATTREPRDDDEGQPKTTDDETQPVTAPQPSSITDDETQPAIAETDPDASEDVAAPPKPIIPKITVPGGRVAKRKDHGDGDVEMREVEGKVSPYPKTHREPS
jgi:hypothetical protein